MPVEPGRRLTHYRLLERVGGGGMGVVYRAIDEHLDREVAVKVLVPGRVDDRARQRFRTEAFALSRLNHPNIETAHDFDIADGVDFLVTEYIPGTTLSTELAKRPMDEKELVRIAVQLLEGLVAAHDRGVLHRDLKPSNLRVTPDGRLKILDFGLAKLMLPSEADSSVETLTSTRGIVGSPPYMAPEQLRAESVDERTDLYAAGVVLYEMATGRRPHDQPLLTALVESVLHDTPVAPRALNPRISPELERIIVKCLDKDPENRYQSAKELAVDLRRLADPTTSAILPTLRPARSRWRIALVISAALVGAAILTTPWLVDVRDWLGAPAAPDRIESLAVLPFSNLSNDHEQRYFVDGMHEAVIADLAQIHALRVISRTSVLQYRDARKTLPEIGRELRVDAIVEGAILRAGDRVRITAQLVHAASDSHLWAGTYERDLRDVLQLQRDTARAIAREIRVVVTPEEEARLESERPVDPAAYDAYLKGRYYLNQRTEREILRSLDFFEESIEIDPSWTLAHAARAEAAILTGWYSRVSPTDAFPRAKSSVETALALDATSAEAHTVAAAVSMLWDWDQEAAEAGYRRAIELNPNHARAHHWYALYLVYSGRYDEAIVEIQKAQELDPLSIIIHTIAGLTYCFADRFDEAMREAEKILEMDPDFPLALSVLQCAYTGLGRHEDAIESARRAAEASGGVVEMADLAEVYAAANRRDEAFEIVKQLEARADHEYVSAFELAEVHLALGNHEAALDKLEQAYEEHAWEMILLPHPKYDALRTNPRFVNLARRVGLP